MLAPAIVLVCLAFSLGLLPNLGSVVQSAAVQLQEQAGYAARVLHAAASAHLPKAPSPGSTGITSLGLGSALGTVARSVLLALVSLYRRRLSAWRFRGALASKVVYLLDGFRSGVVNDYVTWFVIGLACIGAPSP